MPYKIFFLNMLLINNIFLLGGCSSRNNTDHIPAVENFDLSRYMGVWYEIARLPHSFERDIVNAQAEYILSDSGKIRVINRGERHGTTISAVAVAKIKDAPGSGDLEVSFFYPFYGDYKVIYIDKDYQLAMVTSDSMEHFWILSRKPQIPPEQLSECLKKAENWGFEIKLLQYPNGQML